MTAAGWLLVGAGAAIAWSLMGIPAAEGGRRRRRLLLGIALAAVGIAVVAGSRQPSGERAAQRAAADAFTVARLAQGRAAAARWLAPESRVLARTIPVHGARTRAEAERAVRDAVVDDCGRTPIFEHGGPGQVCVTYADGTAVALSRTAGGWRVVSFAAR